MIGLALGAKALAMKRALASIDAPFWYSYAEDKDWNLQSRSHGRAFYTSPTAHYYRIIDNISAGRKP